MKKLLILVGILAVGAATQAQSICQGYGVLGTDNRGGIITTNSFTIGAQTPPFFNFGKGTFGYGASTFVARDPNNGNTVVSVSMYSRNIDFSPGFVSFTGPAIIYDGGVYTFGTATVSASDSPGGDQYSVSTSTGYSNSGVVVSGGISIY